MPLPKLTDEIDSLFERLIREPWSRPLPAPPRTSGERVLDLTLPVAGCERGHMSVTVEGRQLNIALRRRRAAADAGAAQHEEQRESFLLPDGVDVSTLEARFEGDNLRVRLGLRPRRRGK